MLYIVLKCGKKNKFPVRSTQFDRIHSCGSKNYLFLTHYPTPDFTTTTKYYC
ncbi:hypothetical protein Hanom_Chr00s000007g01615091 [Helianthus anomalus]